MSLFEWIKRNKLAVIIISVLLFIVIKDNSSLFMSLSPQKYRSDYIPNIGYESKSMIADSPEAGRFFLPDSFDTPPQPDIQDRLVIQDSNISLQVENVRESTNRILEHTKSLNGYMVTSSLQNPEDTASATITVRIPAKSLNEALNYFRNLAVKTVSENLRGKDVTDQYVDIEAKLLTLNKTRSKFEEIINQATTVDQILKVQREIINLQTQIDNLKGQQLYLERNAELAKITIYLATDELALPYAPSESWRPNVIFKQAVRSLISTLRSVGSLLIWLGVYSIIWIPLVIILVFVIKRKKSSFKKSSLN